MLLLDRLQLGIDCPKSSPGPGRTRSGSRSRYGCYDSFTYFSLLIFLIYSLHAPTSCLLFLVYILISFYRLSFLSCTALLFMHSLMHSTITHAQSCTVLHSLLTNVQLHYTVYRPLAWPSQSEGGGGLQPKPHLHNLC